MLITSLKFISKSNAQKCLRYYNSDIVEYTAKCVTYGKSLDTEQYSRYDSWIEMIAKALNAANQITLRPFGLKPSMKLLDSILFANMHNLSCEAQHNLESIQTRIELSHDKRHPHVDVTHDMVDIMRAISSNMNDVILPIINRKNSLKEDDFIRMLHHMIDYWCLKR